MRVCIFVYKKNTSFKIIQYLKKKKRKKDKRKNPHKMKIFHNPNYFTCHVLSGRGRSWLSKDLFSVLSGNGRMIHRKDHVAVSCNYLYGFEFFLSEWLPKHCL